MSNEYSDLKSILQERLFQTNERVANNEVRQEYTAMCRILNSPLIEVNI